jgi:thymidylate kinase
VYRIIFNYRKYAKTFAVIAPDGTGKTTFLDTLIEQLNYYYVNDENDHRFHVYHFRPEILPNLGQVGEKAGVMKQDTDFTNPHRSKPANPISSLMRIAYYTLDYIIGWQKCVRNDVHYDRYSVFDRYSYDFIVDPLRTKLNLPKWLRSFFVALTPQPKIVFYLDADPQVIYERKQELTLEEIERQVGEYRELANSNPKKFKIINAEKKPEDMALDALAILLEQYTDRF